LISKIAFNLKYKEEKLNILNGCSRHMIGANSQLTTSTNQLEAIKTIW